MSTMAGLLEGVRVVECAVLHVGDYLGCLLGDQGADVIKVESPKLGDYVREIGGYVGPGNSLYHLFENRNKRSVTLDLKQPEGREALRKVIATADVFVTGNVPGTPEQLGFDYATLSALKPDIVYCQATGFGAAGPYSKLPTHGHTINALTGDPVLRAGDDGYPVVEAAKAPPGGWMRGTILGPLYAAFGVASALSRRDRTGKGCYIDVSASDAVLTVSWQRTMRGLNADRLDPARIGYESDSGVWAKYTYYETKDGKFVLIAAIERRFWERFCRAVARPDLLASYNAKPDLTMDMTSDEELRATLAALFRERTQAEWIDLAVANEVPIGPAFASLDEVADDPHLRWRGAFVDTEHPAVGKIRMPGNPLLVDGEHFAVHRHAPALGEHTDEILVSVGYTSDDIAALRSGGVC